MLKWLIFLELQEIVTLLPGKNCTVDAVLHKCCFISLVLLTHQDFVHQLCILYFYIPSECCGTALISTIYMAQTVWVFEGRGTNLFIVVGGCQILNGMQGVSEL